MHFEIVVCKHAAHANSKAKCLSSQDILPFVSCKSSFQLYSRFSWIFNPFLYNLLFCLTFLFFLLNFYNIGLDLLIILGCFPITMLKCWLYEVTCVHIQEKCALDMFITLTRTFFLTLLHEGMYRTTKKTA